MAQNLKTEALVIYSMRWSESSRIVHLFTAEKGLIKVIARGALKPRSSFRGILENLNHIEAIISMKESRGLQIISQADLLNPFIGIREDLEALAAAFSIAEIVRGIIHENENSTDIFRITISILAALNHDQETPPLVFLIYFLLHSSDYLGFGWNLSECKNCGKTPQSFPLSADVENGALYCHDCPGGSANRGGSVSQEQWKLLIGLQNSPPEGVSGLMKKLEEGIKLKSLIDLLMAHLNYHTEQNLQLKSLKMFMV